MESKTWPTGDREWVARYRFGMTGSDVPAPALEERESELLDSVRATGLSAAELLGDAEELAAEDAADLATVQEAVRTCEGGGLRPVMWEVGALLTSIGSVSAASIFIRNGWFVDVNLALGAVAIDVLVGAIGGVVARTLFSAGRSHVAAVAVVVTGAVVCGGAATAVRIGPGRIAATDFSVPLLTLGMLAPGAIVLLVTRLMPQQQLRENWGDAEWLRVFRGGLRARLVPGAAARGHVAEIQQAITTGSASAVAEFGHPLVLARELAQVDHTVRARRWWVSTVASAGVPALIAALVLTSNSWGAFSVPAAMVLLVGSVFTLVSNWRRRPWSAAQ